MVSNGYSQGEFKKDQAYWIWYPGDFEIWLSNKILGLRQQRGVIMPPIWPLYHHYNNVKFRRWVSLDRAEKVKIAVEGQYVYKIGPYIQYENTKEFLLPKGDYEISITILNYNSLPTFWLEGETVFSDTSWEVTFFDGKYTKAGAWYFYMSDEPPSKFALKKSPIDCKILEKDHLKIVLDFQKETFAYLNLNDIMGTGSLKIYYGESLEEAMSNKAETIDVVFINNDNHLQLNTARTFRYVRIIRDAGLEIGTINALFEYLPLVTKGWFSCSDSLLNKIWSVSDYTFRLTAREFFIDGIKRDRWLWSGDALQSYLMNYYTCNDFDLVKRTIIALRGKEPVYTHINTILDYSFFWIISIYDYYFYSGDLDFVKWIYPKIETLLEFCLSRLNRNGLVEAKPGDWVFIDWTKPAMSKEGELCFEQILFYQSLKVFSMLSELTENQENFVKYRNLASDVLTKINRIYLREDGLYVHRRINNKIDDKIFKHPNIMAVYYGMSNQDNSNRAIKDQGLLNLKVPEIITPYMKFYELSALCELGEHELVLEKIRSYWGGMLSEGATTFWETYDPNEKGVEHFIGGNIDRPYSKSLCHSWGATPLYILGKYFLGVKPLSPGYESYLIEPNLGNLTWISGVVPLNQGKVSIFADKKSIIIKTNKSGGICRFKSNQKPKGEGIKKIGENYYQLYIKDINKEYKILLDLE